MVNHCNDFERALLMYKFYHHAVVNHNESNWAKFLTQDLEGAVCSPAHLFHRVGNQPN